MDFLHLLKDSSRIEQEDVLLFRREVFGDAVVSLSEADGVFAMNDHVHDTCAEWDQFFVEVMTDYLVTQARPEGYISQNNADWLIKKITADGHLKSDTELELLVKIIERAHSVPENLSTFALKEVAEAVLKGDGELLRDEELTPGVIGKPEAQLIRRILYGFGAGGQVKICQAEVDVLFDLNDQTVEVENHPEWNDVFVKAVTAYLMMASGYQHIDKTEVLRREQWLDDTSTNAVGMLTKSLGSLSGLFSDGRFSAAKDAMQNPMDKAWHERNHEDAMEAIQSEPVDQSEARWLVERIGRDGVLHENEKALLRYLKSEAISISPVLQPLLDKVA